MAAALLVTTMSAQEQLFMMSGNGPVGVPTPGENDPALVLNETSGAYEGTVTLNKNAFAFYYYNKENAVVKVGPEGLYSVISFASNDTFEDVCVENSNGRWYVSSFANSASTAQVDMSVNITEGTVFFMAEEGKLPEITDLYMWGSTNGGNSFPSDLVAEFEKDENGLFTLTLPVPECGNFVYPDPEFQPSEGAPDHGYYFMITTNGESISGGNFYGAPLDNRYFDLDEGAFNAALQFRNGSSMVCMTPGNVLFSFNPVTLEFTAELVEEEVSEEVKVTLNYSCEGLSNVYEFVYTTSEAFSGKFLSDVEINSDNYSFTCIPAVGLNFEPTDGYFLKSVTTDIKDANLYNLFAGKYQASITLFAGLPAKVNIYIQLEAENGPDSIETLLNSVEELNIVTLDGIKVNVKNLNELQKGVYIINGKKIIL